MLTLDTAFGPPADPGGAPEIGAPAIVAAVPRLTVGARQRRG